ncbi:dihydrofolate reductase family protein [Planctomonas psychrotolerans]|uniref:dihydrofolate reductase family protein n=1 Tax=Planctomonas psychrotolerans TaxID=2528712 RepID=UPI001238F103|nr:dihydrofolate reductase family protein [Planctomonas psychrotolerans]
MSTQYYVASTVDGFIADNDDGIDWLLDFGFDEFTAHFDAFLAGVGAIVMGSATYEYILGEGPSSWSYGSVPTWVLTTRDLPGIEGARIEIGPLPVAEAHARATAAAGDRNVWVVGGGSVAAQFADAGLLDEVLVTVVPVFLGEGKRLLPVTSGPRRARLEGSTPFPSGCIELRYALGS